MVETVSLYIYVKEESPCQWLKNLLEFVRKKCIYPQRKIDIPRDRSFFQISFIFISHKSLKTIFMFRKHIFKEESFNYGIKFGNLNNKNDFRII